MIVRIVRSLGLNQCERGPQPHNLVVVFSEVLGDLFYFRPRLYDLLIVEKLVHVTQAVSHSLRRSPAPIASERIALLSRW